MAVDSKNALDVISKLGLSGQCAGNGEHLVICLHGWLDNSNSFLPMLKLVNDDDEFTWLAIDLHGHGKSQWRSKDAHYYFVDYVYDLKQVIDALNIKSVMLLGHSMGAMVCNLYAACFPECVSALAMIDGIGLVTTKPSDTKQQLKNAFRQRSKTTISNKVKTFASFADVVKARVRVSDLCYEHAETLMKRNIEFANTGVKLTTDPRLKQHSGFRFSAEQALASLENISTPTLFIKATNGFTTINEQFNLFKKCFINIQVSTIEGGHHCHMENASDTLQTVTSHFKAFKERDCTMNKNVGTSTD